MPRWPEKDDGHTMSVPEPEASLRLKSVRLIKAVQIGTETNYTWSLARGKTAGYTIELNYLPRVQLVAIKMQGHPEMLVPTVNVECMQRDG